MVIPIIMPMVTHVSSGGSVGVEVEVQELNLDTPEGHQWELKLEENYMAFFSGNFVIQAYLWKGTRIVSSFRCRPNFNVVRRKARRVSKSYVKTLRGLYNK